MARPNGCAFIIAIAVIGGIAGLIATGGPQPGTGAKPAPATQEKSAPLPDLVDLFTDQARKYITDCPSARSKAGADCARRRARFLMTYLKALTGDAVSMRTVAEYLHESQPGVAHSAVWSCIWRTAADLYPSDDVSDVTWASHPDCTIMASDIIRPMATKQLSDILRLTTQAPIWLPRDDPRLTPAALAALKPNRS